MEDAAPLLPNSYQVIVMKRSRSHMGVVVRCFSSPLWVPDLIWLSGIAPGGGLRRPRKVGVIDYAAGVLSHTHTQEDGTEPSRQKG